MSSIESIRNYVQLTPTIGTSGQPLVDQFQFIADAGFNTVINIAMPDHANSIDEEGRLVTELGMNYRVSVFMYHYLTTFEAFSSEQARSPIFDRWQIEPQWQAIMGLDQQELLERR